MFPRQIIYGISLSLVLLYGGASQAQRYIPSPYNSSVHVSYTRSWDVLVPDTSAADFHTETPVDRAQMTTVYFDGLGRPMQTVARKASLMTDPANPTSTLNSKDIVTAVEYDGFGRQQFKYLPYVANNAGNNASIRDGMFKLNPFEQQEAFYNDANADNPLKGQGENFFYGQSVFESASLNRLVAQYDQGNNWTGASRGVTMTYLLNTLSDSVRLWRASNVAAAVPTTTAVYAAGELYKTIITDEKQNQSIEYKDKEGKLILRKVQLEASPGTAHVGWLCTYYIYDTRNNLRFVLQPKAVKTLLNSGNWVISDVIRDELCFYYGYDDYKHIVIKKTPGAGEVYMVYDSQDRPVMMQDANMRASSRWFVTLYDSLNRPIQKGLVINSSIGSKSFASHLLDASVSTSYPFGTSSIPSSGYEELVRTGYDDYTDLPSGAPADAFATTYITGTNFITTYDASPEYAQQISQSHQIRGAATWTKTKILGTSSAYLYETFFYDRWGRAIQTQSTNISGGVDTATMQYAFSGKVLRSHIAHNKSGTNAQRYYILTKNIYDGLQRLITVKKRVNKSNNNNTDDHIILQNAYDALGQPKTKKIGTSRDGSGDALETINYTYNIRGWLIGANSDYAKDSNATGHYFGFDLGYDKTSIASTGGSTIGNYTSAQYNGNIGGLLWKSAGDSRIRKYDFTYDAVNRLTSADFTQYTSGNFDKSGGLDFSVKNLTYDANGNILSMNQRGWKVGGSITIDSLLYNYYTSSNKLTNVIDRSNNVNTTLGDFRSSGLYMTAIGNSKSNTAVDYTYDSNGNLLRDLNKDIVTSTGTDGIEYNYLNLPQKITFKADSGNKGTIEYVYNALGVKLKKITTEGTTINTTLYAFGVFVNDTLQYLPQEGGRIRYSEDSSQFNYDYFITDHLGNIRMVLTEENRKDVYPPASMELADSTIENALYSGLGDSRDNLPPGYPTDTYTNPNNKISKLSGATGGHKIGPAIILKVMSGDKYNVRVSDWYKLNGNTPNSPNPITDLATILATSLGGAIGAKASSAELAGSTTLTSDAVAFFNSQLYNSAKPKAYLNWILFDEQFNFVPDASGSEQVGDDNTLNIHQLSDMPVTENGYLYIYVSNETPNVNVYFDNLQVTHLRGPILEETHYYPFGLTMNGISSKAASFGGAQNSIRYSGKEEQHEEFSDKTGLEEYDFGSRFFDPQIGRWHNTDPKSEKYFSLSSYAYVANNPLLLIDPNGEEIWITYGDHQQAMYREGKLYDEHNKEIKMGKDFDKFARKVVEGLNTLRSEEFGRQLVDNLAGKPDVINIAESPVRYSYTEKMVEEETGTNAYNISLTQEDAYAPEYWESDGQEIHGAKIPFFVVIGHELSHVRAFTQKVEEGIWYYGPTKDPVSVTEWDAMVGENFIRSEHNMQLRASYGSPLAPDGFIMDDASFDTPQSRMFQSIEPIYMPGKTPDSPPVVAIWSYLFVPRPKPLKQ